MISELAQGGAPAHDGVVSPTEPPGVRTRQLWLTAVVIALAIWMALEFLTPIAWAAVIAIAEWPLYRRALNRFPNRPGLVTFAFAVVTALFVIGPLDLPSV